MNSCEWCEQPTDNEKHPDVKYHLLCDDCYNQYEDKTGYCSFDCCMSGRCDESC